MLIIDEVDAVLNDKFLIFESHEEENSADVKYARSTIKTKETSYTMKY